MGQVYIPKQYVYSPNQITQDGTAAGILNPVKGYHDVLRVGHIRQVHRHLVGVWTGRDRSTPRGSNSRIRRGWNGDVAVQSIDQLVGSIAHLFPNGGSGWEG